MDIISLIKARKSIRKYLNKKIPGKVLEDLVDCGRLAPSGHNRQEWVFLVVTEESLKEKISAEAKYGKFIKDASACIAIFCSEEAATPLEDACAANENIIIAAQAYGLGTCWINAYKKEHSGNIKKILNCPYQYGAYDPAGLGLSGGEPSGKAEKAAFGSNKVAEFLMDI